MSALPASELIGEDNLVVVYETADPTALPVAESLLREVDVLFTWRDVGLSSARQGGGYQLAGAALYQLLVRESDRGTATDALAALEASASASVESISGNTDQGQDPDDDGRPVAYRRRRAAKFLIAAYLICLVMVVATFAIFTGLHVVAFLWRWLGL